MTLNFSGPYQMRIHYQVNGQPHTQRLNCNIASDPGPGFPFSNYSVIQRNLANIAGDLAIDNWITLVDSLFNTADCNFNDAEMWKYNPASEDATFHAAYSIGATGASVSATVDASQGRMSFITTGGGTMFLDFMGTVRTPGVTDPFPFAGVEEGAIATFILGTTNWVLARDNNHPVAARNWNPGQNEALWKKLNRL